MTATKAERSNDRKQMLLISIRWFWKNTISTLGALFVPFIFVLIRIRPCRYSSDISKRVVSFKDRKKVERRRGPHRNALVYSHNQIFIIQYKTVPCFPLVNNQPQLSIVLHYSYRKESLSVWRESFFLNQECLNWINSLISHNSSGHAFSSLLSIFPYAMMEMEYLGSAEF